ncbi:hypothetical protein ONZ45_g7052 [Pleurotus djamor]|nr:hypothetical protein ONZ45_g7052 [Pleurotus djamor]
MVKSLPTTTNERASSIQIARSETTPSFIIDSTNKSYRHQYSNIYFVRLGKLRDFVLGRAQEKWKDIEGNPVMIPRVLEVEKGQLCYIVGTVYMEMPLKPNVLEDIAKDRSILPPAPRPKICSPEDTISLEDESGRITLVGERLKKMPLLTGIVIGVLGIETPNGEFEVADVCFPGMPPQESSLAPEASSSSTKMDVDMDLKPPPDEWVGLVSGLDIGPSSLSDILVHMLVEYLAGENGGPRDQASAAQITRLIIAGNSLAPVELDSQIDNMSLDDKKHQRRGHESTSFSPHPVRTLASHLLDISQAMPVHILPGPNDPSGCILPQQPFPRSMLGSAAICETNPTWLHLEVGSGEEAEENEEVPSTSPSTPDHTLSRKFLVTSGQTLDDMFKYLESPPHTRLSILENTLKWRHMAPTAPDTLWCHPYFESDPFILPETPDVYVVGCQQRFGTRLISEDDPITKKKTCRIIMVPNFSETGILVLLNMRTLQVKTVRFVAKGAGGRKGGEREGGSEISERWAADPDPDTGLG